MIKFKAKLKSVLKPILTGILFVCSLALFHLPILSEPIETMGKAEMLIVPLKDQIRFKREERELSIPQLAQKVKCSPTLLEKVEKGESLPSRELLVAIQRALKAEFILDGY